MNRTALALALAALAGAGGLTVALATAQQGTLAVQETVFVNAGSDDGNAGRARLPL